MKVGRWHVGVAGEATIAALLARCGSDISVQYGANQPEYDLGVVGAGRFLKVSVTGNQDGSWGLTHSFLMNADYHAAIAIWLKRHQPGTILSLVQFKGVDLLEMPGVYLATPGEYAERLRGSAKWRGDTILHERHQWSARAVGAGTIEEIRADWRLSAARVEETYDAVAELGPQTGKRDSVQRRRKPPLSGDQ